MQLAMFTSKADEGSSESAVRFLPVAEGPPGGAHGAAVVTAFDTCIWSTPAVARLVSVSPDQEEVGFTASLTVDFRKVVPLEATLLIRCSLVAAEPSSSDPLKTKWTMQAELLSNGEGEEQSNEVVYGTASALIISVRTPAAASL